MSDERKRQGGVNVVPFKSPPSVAPSPAAFEAAWALIGWVCTFNSDEYLSIVYDAPPEVWPDHETQVIAAAIREIVDEGGAHGVLYNDIFNRVQASGFDMNLMGFVNKTDVKDWGFKSDLPRLVDTMRSDYARRIRVERARFLVSIAERDVTPEDWRAVVNDTDLLEGLPEPRPYFEPMTRLYELASTPIPWAFRDTIPSGVVTVLGAPGGAGKSRIAIGLALSTVLGQPLFANFQPERAGPVVLLSGEDSREHVARTLLGYCSAHHLDSETVNQACAERLFVRAQSPEPFVSVDRRTCQVKRTREFKNLLANCVAVAPALIVVDTLRQHLGGLNENANDEVGAWMRAVCDLAKDSGAAVLVLHHEGKGASNAQGGNGIRQYDLRGASVIGAEARCVWHISNRPDGVVTLCNSKMNSTRIHDDVTLRFVTGGALVEVAPGDDARGAAGGSGKVKERGWRDPASVAETIREYLAANSNRDINYTVLSQRNGVDGCHAYEFIKKRHGTCSRDALKEAVEQGIRDGVLVSVERRTRKGDLSTFLEAGTPAQAWFLGDEEETF